MTLYAVTIFLSAFLLFQVQPLIAKIILPWFGGGAAVWITCMLFFQVGLLAGYAYSHASIRFLSPRSQAFVHILLLIISLLLLPVMPDAGLKPPEVHHPLGRILWLLLWTVGLPYFLLSSTTPLIQAWYARSHEKALPYRLFSLSNLASLAGLLAYPFLIEPGLALGSQSLSWSSLYALFVVLCAIGAVRAAQLNQRRLLIGLILTTLLCSFAFLGIKGIEYEAKWKHGLLWGQRFNPGKGHLGIELPGAADLPATYGAKVGHGQVFLRRLGQIEAAHRRVGGVREFFG